MNIRTRLSACLLLLIYSLSYIQQCECNLAAMSIDLGSDYMKIGLVKPGVPMEIVLNKESRRKTPTIVAFRNGERFFGDVAAQMSVKFPANAITFAVDLVGKQFDNPIVAQYQKDFPHLKLSAHPERNTVVFSIDEKSYEVEVILAMLLWNAREQTQAFADQPVKDVVISVPSYFNQAERVGVGAAAKIAGLHLLSIMSNGAAAALNYGVFRRKDITEKPQNLLVYDIGASKTIATLVEYRLENKDPQVKVLGVGFDRTMGGRDFTSKLREHLVQEFKAKHKTKGDIRENPRAMAKLWKEAERVKQVNFEWHKYKVLSANTEHFAQVESLFEDKDFKVKVSRELIEKFVAELKPRLTQPLDDALKTIDFKPEQVETVVLMGAGTRIPSIQQIVKDYFGGRELARFLNTDEAIALGAVYEAAHLSKGFRVKPFEVQDLNLYPIQVRFFGLVNHTQPNGEIEQVEKEVTREIYPHLSKMPGARKTITFISHKKDFSFNVLYGNLDHLTPKQQSEFGNKKLMEIEVKGVEKALEKEGPINKDADQKAIETGSYKFNGIKAIFKITKYGTVKVDTAELTLEHVEPAKNSTLSAIVDKIGSMFSGGGSSDKPEDEEKTEEAETNEKEAETPSTSSDPAAEKNTTESSGDDSAKKSDESANATDSKANKTESTGESAKNTTKAPAIKPPPKFIRTKLTLDVDQKYSSLSSKQIGESTRVLGEFERAERTKLDLEAASNALESLVYDTAVKLEEDWANKKGFADEYKKIADEVATLKVWIEDEAFGADVSTLRKKREGLSSMIRAVQLKEKKQKEAKLKKQLIKRKLRIQATRQLFIQRITSKTKGFTPITKSGDKHSEL
ncbi:hypothetical protein M3Y97_00486400 [Aphelenchoides bicaudatus]|nr:hypothetical protein M3Y97_00486400 [Aphelenchoides bicaudatus]